MAFEAAEAVLQQHPGWSLDHERGGKHVPLVAKSPTGETHRTPIASSPRSGGTEQGNTARQWARRKVREWAERTRAVAV